MPFWVRQRWVAKENCLADTMNIAAPSSEKGVNFEICNLDFEMFFNLDVYVDE